MSSGLSSPQMDMNTPPTFQDYRSSEHSSHRIPSVRRMIITMCTLVSIIGTAFNLTLLFALIKFRRRTLRNNITNIFVLCLAISDIGLCSVSMPVQMFFEITEHQLASTGLCRVLFAGFGLPMNISCLTILLIAFDRYRMIVHPMKFQLSAKMATALIGFVALFGTLISLPVALYVDRDSMTGFTYCVETWPSPQLRFSYSVSVFMLNFALPLAASGAFYLAIYCRIAKQSTQLGFRKEAERRKRKTTSLLVATVVCFAVCWTPWCLCSLLLEIQSLLETSSPWESTVNFFKKPPISGLINGPVNLQTCTEILRYITDAQAEQQAAYSGTKAGADLQRTAATTNRIMELIPARHIKLIDLLCKVFAMGSTCVNPFLYGWLNEPIRAAMRRQYERFRDCVKRLPNRNQRSNSIPAYENAPKWKKCWTRITAPVRHSVDVTDLRPRLVIEPPVGDVTMSALYNRRNKSADPLSQPNTLLLNPVSLNKPVDLPEISSDQFASVNRTLNDEENEVFLANEDANNRHNDTRM